MSPYSVSRFATKKNVLKLSKRLGALALVVTVAGCSTQQLQKLNNDLAALNAGLAGGGGQAGGTATQATMAVSASNPNRASQTKLIVPTDPRTSAAMDAALPTIKKVLAIHQCVKHWDGMLQLNYLAVPGVDIRMAGRPSNMGETYPNSTVFMKYHDQNKCVTVRTIDNWVMPAFNALQFRAVYFAEDSGETVNFGYMMKKMDDGAWKLELLRQVN